MDDCNWSIHPIFVMNHPFCTPVVASSCERHSASLAATVLAAGRFRYTVDPLGQTCGHAIVSTTGMAVVDQSEAPAEVRRPNGSFPGLPRTM